MAATVSFFWSEPRAIVAASGLAAGTILSRIGLWSYDLSASLIVQIVSHTTQLQRRYTYMRQEVQDDNRGVFSSTEQLFQNAFELISYALIILLPRPDQFQWPVLISGVAVFAAAAQYARFLRGRRGHLIHTCAGKV